VDEWGPSIVKEKKDCFAAVPLPSPAGAHPLPGLWVFTRKRDGTPKACFCVGCHCRIMGRDCLPNNNNFAVLFSRDNRILLALAAAEGYTAYQTDVVQAFLLIQAPVKFKQEVIDWFNLKGNGYLAANDAQTIWIKRDKMGVIIHALYADDFLHFTNNKAVFIKTSRNSLRRGLMSKQDHFVFISKIRY
jgi:hypothetical protein